jgi:transketolase
LEAGRTNQNVVALSADLSESIKMDIFAKEFPKRYFEVGVAEQNLVTIGAGLGISGKIPYVASYAVFSPGRNLEQIRTTICYNDSNVKIIGAHAGLATGPDGATHQALEDIALMRTLPNMKVFVPCDAYEARKITKTVADLWGPTYIRLSRPESSLITTKETPFIPGTMQAFWIPPERKKAHVAIFVTGILMKYALQAAKELENKKIYSYVYNVATIKPFDIKTLLSAVKKCGAVVSIEEHQIAGGLGSLIAETLAEKMPTPQEFVGVRDSFGESGKPEELYETYGLGISDIKRAVVRVIERKNKKYV